MIFVGVPKLIKATMIKPGATVIDVGITRVTDEQGKTKLVGDVDYEGMYILLIKVYLIGICIYFYYGIIKVLNIPLVMEKLLPIINSYHKLVLLFNMYLCLCLFIEVSKIAGAITPVPGGVGPMTVAMLMHNTLQAAQRLASKN